MNNLPLISVIIPVRNEEVNLAKLLPSLSAQSYPRKKIEYIAIDDESTDNSAQMLKNFGAKVFSVDHKKISHPVSYRTEYNKGLGLHKSKGDLVYWLDADMEVCDGEYFKKLTVPLIENLKITGSFTNEFALDCGPLPQNSFLRYLSYDNLQRDPVLEYFSTDISETIIANRPDYYICQFTTDKVPPSGRIMYRRSRLMETEIGLDPAYYDLDALQIMVDRGFQFYAYVPQAKIRHYHAVSFSHFINKRKRNLEGNFFSTLNRKKFVWFKTNNNQDLLKIIFWLIYANLFIPELIRSLIKCFRYKDLACLWQPMTTMVLTDVLLWKSLHHPTGQSMIKKILRI